MKVTISPYSHILVISDKSPKSQPWKSKSYFLVLTLMVLSISKPGGSKVYNTWNGIRHPDLDMESKSSNIPDLSLESVPAPLLGHSFLISKWGIWSCATWVFTWSYKIQGGANGGWQLWVQKPVYSCTTIYYCVVFYINSLLLPCLVILNQKSPAVCMKRIFKWTSKSMHFKQSNSNIKSVQCSSKIKIVNW